MLCDLHKQLKPFEFNLKMLQTRQKNLVIKLGLKYDYLQQMMYGVSCFTT